MLFSIGHGTRTETDFLELLRKHQVRYLADVRSQPRSRFQPHFNRKALETSLASIGVDYVFMGDSLGGRPQDNACYVNGRISYPILASRFFYLEGIERLMTAVSKDLSLALLCSERKPQDCHRSRLIGKTLLEKGVDLLHIDETGEVVPQTVLQARFHF